MGKEMKSSQNCATDPGISIRTLALGVVAAGVAVVAGRSHGLAEPLAVGLAVFVVLDRHVR